MKKCMAPPPQLKCIQLTCATDAPPTNAVRMVHHSRRSASAPNGRATALPPRSPTLSRRALYASASAARRSVAAYRIAFRVPLLTIPYRYTTRPTRRAVIASRYPT
ncbi:hypothetical protein EVAR_15121_1 [Eumeta japonica]|uniref:Uncharacterized protein n=1 Tax=Eumeta variegata TaxID=151549 RepID=A0A4C1UI67_EUMVA|nr:hypothetical protein EVAR_15121_1 [Eumeta japonica]